MTVQIDSADAIQQLKKGDVIFQVHNEGKEKFTVDAIDDRQIVAIRTYKNIHIKMFPVAFLIEGNWHTEKINSLRPV